MIMARALHRISHAIIQSHSSGSVRFYARWVSRNPAKVLLPFESATKSSLKKEKVIDLDPAILNKFTEPKVNRTSPTSEETIKVNTTTAVGDETINTNSLEHEETRKTSFSRQKAKDIKAKKDEAMKKREFYLNQKKVFDDNNEIIYEKLKEKDSRISALLVKLKSKKERLNSGQVLVEGWRLIVDGLEAKCKLKYVLFSRTDDLHKIRLFLPKKGVVFCKIPYKEMQLWSDVETSPGLIGIFEMPSAENVKRFSKPLPLNLICDNIRVPGNLGAILRVAVGAGCDKVLLTKGCVDLWDSKVIRSAAGAHFRLPIYNSLDWEEINKHLEKDSSIFIADSNAENSEILNTESSEEAAEVITEASEMPIIPYYGVQFPSFKHITLIVGGETEGISEESYELAAQHNGVRLHIPLQKGVDSLNTGMAAAIMAFEIKKQFMESGIKAQAVNAT